MKKFTILMSLVCGLSAFSCSEAQQYQTYNSTETYSNGRLTWQNDYNTAVGLSKSTSKPLVILFTGTDWCPACGILERKVLTTTEFANAVGDKFIFLKAEIPGGGADSMNSSPYKPLIDKYHVDAYPTIIVVNANGEVLYNVDYQRDNRPDVYANLLLSKLNQYRNSTAAPTYTY